MTRQRMDEIDQRSPSPPSLLIAAHCATIQRKGKRLDNAELSAIFNDITRELSADKLRASTYLHSLNQVLRIINAARLPILTTISSHYFFLLTRNTIRDLLHNFDQFKRLNEQEFYVIRNAVSLIYHLVQDVPDVSKVLHWIADATFLDALADCLSRMGKLSKKDRNRPVIKHISRLLNTFAIIQERLPIDQHRTLFVRLLQPTVDCLTSTKYLELFQNFQSDSKFLTETQKLYLLKCPFFLTTYNGPHFEQIMENMLEIMLPRYVAILDQHIQTIKQWRRPIMRAIHNLIITIVFAEGYFSPYTHTDIFRSLINHLLIILNEPTFIERIHPDSNNMETLLIDATLIVFNVLVYEPNALDYIKQCKPSKIFRTLTESSYETIVLNAYMMLAYTIDEEEIRASPDDLPQLLSIIVNSLRKTMGNPEQMNHDRSVLQLLETLKGLTQHERICEEILKQNLATFFIDYQAKLHGLPKQVLLECLWQLSFHEQIAQQLRDHSQFIYSLENLPKPVEDYIPSNRLRRSSSFGSRRNSVSVVSMDMTNHGIQKVVDGILWKLVRERQCREKMGKMMRNDREKYRYDILISSSYSDRTMVQSIQQYLVSEGYNVWSERNQNYEHPMKIVADAIENSEFVLICLSDSYKRDNRCQAQAEYAFACKRLLLPVVVHSGFKSDGWLSPLLNNHHLIDFGMTNFESASQSLLEEIKQRQSKKDEPSSRSRVPTLFSTIPNSSARRTVSDEQSISKEYSVFSEATTASSSFGSSLPSAGMDGKNSISKPPISRSSTPATNGTIQRQPESSAQSALRPPTPISIHPTPSMTAYRGHQQQPLTSDFLPMRTLPTNRYEQKSPVQSAFTSSRPSSVASIVSSINNKHQQNSLRSLPRSPTPISFSLDPSVTARIEREQLLATIRSDNVLPNNQVPFNPTFINGQQSQNTIHSGARSMAPASFSSTTNPDVREQPTTNMPISKSELPNANFANGPVNVEKRQEASQPPPNTILQSSTNNASSSPASVGVEGRLQYQTRTNVISAASKSSSASSQDMDKLDEQPQEKLHVDSGSQTSIMETTSESQASSRSYTKSPAPNSLPPVAPVATDQQQRRRRNQSVHSTPKSSLAASFDIENQEPPSSRCNSSSTTPVPSANDSATNLLNKYIHRKTDNSIYRTLSLDAWRNNDVLDYLCDTKLHALMPLCESMSGKALLRLFRMCQKKPTRLYDQLNEELRTRFKGLTLPMGTYTQFFIEMDALINSVQNVLPSTSDPTAKVVERVIVMPRSVQQGQVNSTPSTLSSVSSHNSNNVTVVDNSPESATPHYKRVIERAVYRPASNIGRPYNFIIESVEEPSVLLDQVYRYGNQLLVLDATAHQRGEVGNTR